MKVAVFVPAATVTEAGTDAEASDELRLIVVPAALLPFKVTVPVELTPPRTVVGLTVTEETVAATTVMPAVDEPPP